jgi:hypothetical protein
MEAVKGGWIIGVDPDWEPNSSGDAPIKPAKASKTQAPNNQQPARSSPAGAEKPAGKALPKAQPKAKAKVATHSQQQWADVDSGDDQGNAMDWMEETRGAPDWGEWSPQEWEVYWAEKAGPSQGMDVRDLGKPDSYEEFEYPKDYPSNHTGMGWGLEWPPNKHFEALYEDMNYTSRVQGMVKEAPHGEHLTSTTYDFLKHERDQAKASNLSRADLIMLGAKSMKPPEGHFAKQLLALKDGESYFSVWNAEEVQAKLEEYHGLGKTIQEAKDDTKVESLPMPTEIKEAREELDELSKDVKFGI